MDANEGRFKLRDLLSVPMQRVLKYHLLLKVLCLLICCLYQCILDIRYVECGIRWDIGYPVAIWSASYYLVVF